MRTGFVNGVPARETKPVASLVGHWALDDRGEDGVVRDASHHARHGRVKAATKGRSRPGRIGTAMDFGDNQPVDLSSHADALKNLKDFTLSMWIQYRGGASRILFSWSDGTLNRRMQVEVHQNRLHFGWNQGVGWQAFGTAPLQWKSGEWYHVVFVNDCVAGKTALRSNDGAQAAHGSTLAPADLRGVSRVQLGALNDGYPFGGLVDDVRLYDIPLSRADIRALYLGKPISGKRPFRPVLATALEKDWFFQAEGKPLLQRAHQEVGWAKAMAARLDSENGLAELVRLERKANGLSDADEEAAWELYLAVRKLKRRIMFSCPEVDFDEIVLVDIPYTQGREWQHESRYRSPMCATHGGELLILKGLSPEGEVRRLAPAEGRAALFRPDVSFDGRRVLFCMKPEAEKAYHLYEADVDGSTVRQLTFGKYSDVDPVYLPDSGIAFLTSRANVYGGCAPWAPQHIMARCDAEGKNIYLLSVASEPEYSPSVLDDGRVIYTRWEYNDKALNRIQGLWTMNPDGAASQTYWGNQSTYPDHLGEARQIPGTSLVMFTGMGHHDMYRGCIGIIDKAKGLNFPHGVTKVTAEVPWPEVGDGPVPTPAFAAEYHSSGAYGGYKSPYPLGKDLFLVSARTGNAHAGTHRDSRRGLFKLYLMDTRGNRELIYEGKHNVLYAQPLKARKRPRMPASFVEKSMVSKGGGAARNGLFYSSDVYEGMPDEIRGKGRYLRVLEAVQRTYTTGCVDGGGTPFGSGECQALDMPRLKNGNPQRRVIDTAWGDGAILAGPAIAITSNTRLKQVLGIVPVAEDGSYYFEAPAGKALYFQLLDEHKRVLQSMRSWVNLMPGERRGCVGCHESRLNAPTPKAFPFANRRPDPIDPPSWGVRTLSYVGDIQPIFDKHCATCHQGDGKARKKLDLTLRPDPRKRWGGIFPEPYITLTCGDNAVNNYASMRTPSSTKPTIAGNFFIWAEPYTTIPPMTKWSYQSRLINMHLQGKHNGVKLPREDMEKLIAWVDTNCHFRSLDDVLAIDDPDPNWFLNWPYPPRLRSAVHVDHLAAQDAFHSPSDRLALREIEPHRAGHQPGTPPR